MCPTSASGWSQPRAFTQHVLPCRSFRRVDARVYAGERYSPEHTSDPGGARRVLSGTCVAELGELPTGDSLGHSRLVEMSRDSAQPERESRAEQQAGVDVGG